MKKLKRKLLLSAIFLCAFSMGNHRDITHAQQGTLWMQLQVGIPGAAELRGCTVGATGSSAPGKATLLPLHQCAGLALRTTQGSDFFCAKPAQPHSPCSALWEKHSLTKSAASSHHSTDSKEPAGQSHLLVWPSTPKDSPGNTSLEIWAPCPTPRAYNPLHTAEPAWSRAYPTSSVK